LIVSIRVPEILCDGVYVLAIFLGSQLADALQYSCLELVLLLRVCVSIFCRLTVLEV